MARLGKPQASGLLEDSMNRRRFFASMAAAALAPKAVKLLPPGVVNEFAGIDRTFQPIQLTGLSGWLPIDPFFGFDRAGARSLIPRTLSGRLGAAADMHEEGLISSETFAQLVEVA